jgi:hypothetical protein
MAVELPGPLDQTRQSRGCAPNARRVSVSAAMNDSAKNSDMPIAVAISTAICWARNAARGKAVSAY